jgi:metal-dependent amidase/aminoacylase/carboxypeptidase family protein
MPILSCVLTSGVPQTSLQIACGHDGPTAMLLAAAQHLAATRDFDGTVYLIFSLPKKTAAVPAS